MDKIIDFFSALKIVASPFILCAVLGGIFYLYKPDMTGIIIGSLIALIGLAIGIYLAIRIQKKVGATEFMSRINASPDFDDLNKKK